MTLDGDLDDYPGMDLLEFTEADFAEIDSLLASISHQPEDLAIPGIPGTDDNPDVVSHRPLNSARDANESDTDTVHDVVVHGGFADVSFRSDDFDLNLNGLSAEEFAALDEELSLKSAQHSSGPSITIEIEETAALDQDAKEIDHTNNQEKPWKYSSPLDEFRSYMVLSVTDLVSPSWCEVQYDYGLRGKRHRPISQRPKSFASSTGNIISPEVTIMKENDIHTKQGLAVHKQLEREIRFYELQVELTTDETRWALRIVNMLSCLRGIMHGYSYTREMPVFGILHDEVVIGIMDEIVKEEVFSSPNGKRKTTTKRPLSRSSSQATAKRPRTETSSVQTHIDNIFESPKKTGGSSSLPSVGYILHIKDNKTRKNRYLPTDPDMYSGRLQLMLYRRLLCDLLKTDPPYDFTAIWRKVDVDPSAIFPTKFLVQAQLIQESDGFRSACLNDLVNIWHEEVKSLNILGVDPNLELVYRLRPPAGRMEERNAIAKKRLPPRISDEDQDLAKAIAASLEETSTPLQTVDVANPGPAISCSEDMELQWALHESSAKDRPQPLAKESMLSEGTAEKVVDKGKGKEKEDAEPTPKEGIRRFQIIGTKKFLYNDDELDRYLDHVMQWWRGERKPEGVPLERVYRCSTCEFVNDCEWRTQKALELRRGKSSTLP